MMPRLMLIDVAAMFCQMRIAFTLLPLLMLMLMLLITLRRRYANLYATRLMPLLIRYAALAMLTRLRQRYC